MKRVRESRIVRGDVLGAFAKAMTAFELALEAGARFAAVQTEPSPTQTMFRG